MTPAGSDALSAVAYDFGNGVTTNSISITAVDRASIRLAAPTVVAGQFQMGATGLTPGKQAVLQACALLSTSASQWVAMQTNTADSASDAFTTPILPGSQFFRVAQLP